MTRGPVGLSAIRRAARRQVEVRPVPRAPWWVKVIAEAVAALVLVGLAYAVVSDREDRRVFDAWQDGAAYGRSSCSVR